jgi:hypothetical protein
MDEPTHARESQFWDEVAEWLLDARALDARDLTPDEIEALLRHMHEGQEPT